jgi:predicted restriction endonuclease
MPLWHLSSNKAWFWVKAEKVVGRSTFPTGKPKTERQFLDAVDYGSVPKCAMGAWISGRKRQALKEGLIAMLLADDDDASQAMGEYLRSRFVGRDARALSEDGLIADSEFPEDLRFPENYSRYRTHKRIERNPRLATAVKRVHGTTCAICWFDFERAYGIVGRGYIEAHHLVPVATRKGISVELDARHDFVVLCANCHRMVHRAGLPNDLSEFRQRHIKAEYLHRGLNADK